jgi:hypothetical protein
LDWCGFLQLSCPSTAILSAFTAVLCPQGLATFIVLYQFVVWRRVSAIPEAKLHPDAAKIPHARVLAELSTTAVQCSFVAGNADLCLAVSVDAEYGHNCWLSPGNVFFEVLFSDVGR